MDFVFLKLLSISPFQVQMRLEHLGMTGGKFQIESIINKGRLIFRMDNSCGSKQEEEFLTQGAPRRRSKKRPRRLLGLIALQDPHCAWMQVTKLLICHISWTHC